MDAKSPPRVLSFGDMQVIGNWPAKMLKALAVVADTLHQTYDTLPYPATPGWSKQTCVFSSLCIRDFLVAIGYPDATGRSVTVMMMARDLQGAQIHSLGIGVPDDPDKPNKFNGHLICTVPSLNLMIDSTLFQAQRRAWRGALPSMMAVDYSEDSDRRDPLYGLKPINAMTQTMDDRVFDVMWLDRPELKWKRDRDFKRNDRRRAVTAAMVARFGEWHD